MGKYAIAAALVLLLASVMQYVLLSAYPLQGMVFNSVGEDEALFISAILLPEFGFESPWAIPSDNINMLAFLNPANGPVFMLLPAAALHAISGIDARILFLAFKVVSASLMLFSAFLLVKHFEKKYTERVFILLVFAAGFGGIVHLAVSFFHPERIFYPMSLFGFGVGMFRFVESYQAFSLATGILSLVFYLRNRYIVSGLLAGLTLLFYPVHGISFLLVIAIHYAVFSGSGIAKTFVTAAAFSIVWVASYVIQPELFHNYSNTVGSVSINVLPSVIIGMGPLVLLAAYDMKKRFAFVLRPAFLVVFILSSVLISFCQASLSVWLGLGDLPAVFTILSAPFLALVAYSMKKVWESAESKDMKFFYLWFLAFLFIAMFPVKIFSLLPPKAVVFMYFPLAVIGYHGIKSAGWHEKRTVAAIIMVCAVSIFFFYSFEQMDARSPGDSPYRRLVSFYPEDDVKALKFLKSQPYGTVFSSPEIGTFLSYYSGKKALLFGSYRRDIVLDLDKKLSDYEKFFSSPDNGILNKYGIKYVFYGTFERRIGALPDVPYLKRIYENGTEIYEVIM